MRKEKELYIMPIPNHPDAMDFYGITYHILLEEVGDMKNYSMEKKKSAKGGNPYFLVYGLEEAKAREIQRRLDSQPEGKICHHEFQLSLKNWKKTSF
jgi:hypothetical protein